MLFLSGMKKQSSKSSFSVQRASLVVSPAKTGEEYSHPLFWLDAISRSMSDMIQNGGHERVYILDCPFYYIYSFLDQYPAHKERLFSALGRGAIVTRPFFGFQSNESGPEFIIRSLLLSRRYGAAYTACIDEHIYESDMIRAILREFHITRLYILDKKKRHARSSDILLFDSSEEKPQSVHAELVRMPGYSGKSNHLYTSPSLRGAVMNMVHMVEPLSAITKTAVGKQAVENLPFIWKHLCQPEPGFTFSPADLCQAAEQGLIQAGLCLEDTGKECETLFNTAEQDRYRVTGCSHGSIHVWNIRQQTNEPAEESPGNTGTKAPVSVQTVPALGYCSIYSDTVLPKKPVLPPVVWGRFFMENKYLRITAETDGTFSIYDKANENLFDKMGGIVLFKKRAETGEWQKIPFTVSAPRISMAECSTERTVLKIRTRYRIKRGAGRQGVDTVKVWAACVLERTSDTAVFHYDCIDDNARYLVSVQFASGCSSARTTEFLENGTLRARTHSAQESFPSCRIDSVSVSEPGRSLYVASSRQFMHTLALDKRRTLLCSVLLPDRDVSHKKFSTEFIVKTAGDRPRQQTADTLHAVRRQLYRPPCMRGCFPEAAPRFSLLAVKRGTLSLGTCKPAENSPGYILRFYNYTAVDQKETLVFGHRVKELHACFCDERIQHRIDVSDGRAHIQVSGNSICTLLVIPEAC